MLTTNIDTTLEIISTVAWLLFGIFTALFFIRNLVQDGLAASLIRLFSFNVLIPFVLVVGLNLLSAALVFIQPQMIGVVVSVPTQGGVRPQPFQGGLQWIFPFFEEVKLYPIYWQTYTMSGKTMEGQARGDDSIRARTKDGQEVHLDISVIFKIDINQAVRVHVDWQDRYINDLVRPMIRGFVRTEVSQFTVTEVNSSVRKDLEASLDRQLREEFLDKGLILDRFLLRDITFSPEYATAIELKQVALEEQLRKEREAEQLRRLARGQADALRLIGEALQQNPDILTYRYIDKLSPNIRVMLVPNNNPLILPLPDLEAGQEITSTFSSTSTLDLPITETLDVDILPETSDTQNQVIQNPQGP